MVDVVESDTVTMTKVLSHTPAWLSRPAPGFQVFQPAEKARSAPALSNGQGKKLDYRGPVRTIAHRGTQVFFVAGNEIRWSDLVLLKDAGEEADTLRRSLRTGAASVGQQDVPIEGQEASLKYSRVNMSHSELWLFC